MENTLIFELNNWKITSIDYIEFRYEPTWTPFGVCVIIHILIGFENFKYIQDIQDKKFKIHKNNICFDGCIRSVEYHDDYLKVSLLVDDFINYQQNPLFIKMNRKLKISDILDTM